VSGARSLALVGLFALAAGCATPPKPPELSTFERMRADPAANVAAKKYADLINSADRWMARSRDEWQSNDLEKASHSALMGQIKLKQALAMAEQERAKGRIATATVDIDKSTDENSRLQKELAALNAQVALLQRLQAQTVELSTERQKATASEKIADAELALKNADSMRASNYAKAQYQTAVDMLARAQQEAQQGNFAAAQISADQAKHKADEAADVAKPMYQEDARSAESRATAEDLAREAASIPGISARRDVRDKMQRLVLPIPADTLFVKRETTIGPGKGGPLLDRMAALIKKYQNPVQVIGYTDSRGRSGELLALSLARAQAVYTALVSRGVDARRLVVSGQGASEPISDNRTIAGRAQNNRVEIIFAYQ